MTVITCLPSASKLLKDEAKLRLMREPEFQIDSDRADRGIAIAKTTRAYEHAPMQAPGCQLHPRARLTWHACMGTYILVQGLFRATVRLPMPAFEGKSGPWPSGTAIAMAGFPSIDIAR